MQVREYFGQFVSKQAQSVIDDILAKREFPVFLLEPMLQFR